MRENTGADTLQSIHHPGSAPPSLVYARWLRGPLVFALSPALVIALLLALTGNRPLPFLFWSIPSGYLLASAWTVFQLRRTTAEVSIRAGSVALRSVWQIATKASKTWERLLRVLYTGHALEISLGQTVHTLLPEEWPEYRRMVRRLETSLAENTFTS